MLGALFIGFACVSTGWEAIGRYIWGLLIAGAGLTGSALFSLVCAIADQRWRPALIGHPDGFRCVVCWAVGFCKIRLITSGRRLI
jgi:hypothetical protein